jgi:RNA polymerase sigma factor (sigma-70 family)
MSLTLNRLLHRLRRVAAPPEDGSDADLLARFVRRRDEDAFSALVGRHGPMVLNACRRLLGDAHDAEDAFQATFLVLARKAASVGRPEALAGWLYGVAGRVAGEARRRRARRPRPVPGVAGEPTDPRPSPLDRLTARELLEVLEDEVRGLPEAYRLPVVLCCLEGLSQEEAARRLGCTAGAVKGRLERGRQRLHDRLARRGLTLSAVLGAAVAARGAAAAGLPAATARAATLFAAGEAAEGIISAEAAALTKGALSAMLHTKIRRVTATVLALALTGLAGVVLAARQADDPVDQQGPGPGQPGGPARQADDKPARPVDGPAAYVKVEARGVLMRVGNGHAVMAKDATFPDVTVLVRLERSEDKNSALTAHLRALEGKVVVVTGYLDARRLGNKDGIDLYLSDEKQVRAADAPGGRPMDTQPEKGPGRAEGPARLEPEENVVRGVVMRVVEDTGGKPLALLLRGGARVEVDEGTQYVVPMALGQRLGTLREMIDREVLIALTKKDGRTVASRVEAMASGPRGPGR